MILLQDNVDWNYFWKPISSSEVICELRVQQVLLLNNFNEILYVEKVEISL